MARCTPPATLFPLTTEKPAVIENTPDASAGDYTVMAEGFLFAEGPVPMPDGSVLLVDIERGAVMRASADGEVSVVADVGGGPNGAALGPDGCLYICNNGGFLFRNDSGVKRTRPGVPEGYDGGYIERLDLETGEVIRLYDRCGENKLVGPNDIVFDRHGGFYFTDFGKVHPRRRDHGGLYYALADGSKIVELAFPMTSPNGVGLSPDGTVVYVSETETGRVWAFDLEAPGVVRRQPFPSPHGGRLVITLPGFQRCDSMALDAEGNICVATIITGCISVVSPGGELLRQVPTGNPFTTNIAFGGPDLKTAYITVAGNGQLIKMPWPVPGLALAYG